MFVQNWQLRSVTHQTAIATTTVEPQTMNGLEMQMSLIAPCLTSDSSTGQQCTFTPGLVADRSSIDPQFFVPTRIEQTSNVGDAITPESLAAIRQPGFQAGANGQEIGIDLYFPNGGTFAGNSQSEATEVERKEKIEYAYAGTFSRIRQIVKANDTEAVLGRTVRGFTVFVEGENPSVNLAIQGAAQLFPEVVPKIEGSQNPVNTRINSILYRGASNVRLPGGSFTIYSVGVGRALSLTPDITSPKQVPRANYNSIWLGLSPVINRSFGEGRIFYQATGPQRAIASGGEGGEGGNVEFAAAVNEDLFSTENLDDFYTQVYLTSLSQDVNFVRESVYLEKVSYYPHLSLTGNRTGLEDMFRYYAGIIAAEEVKAYLGADYSFKAKGDWNFRVGGVGYLNPDRDYYSQLWGNASKTIRLGKKANLVLATGFNYAIDRESKIGDVTSISPASEVAAIARFNWGLASLGVTNYFGGILPNSIGDRLVIELSFRPLKKLRVSGYIAPVDKTTSRSPYGASVTWQLGNKYNSQTLSLSWQSQEYDYGDDPFGNRLLIKDNIFTVSFRVGARLGLGG